MARAREVRKRMKAVASIRRITKTMQMIATSKFAKSQQRATASKPYTEGVFELVKELAARAGNISHPLIDGPAGGPGGRHIVLVLTSDRGFCGPYNGSVLRLCMNTVRGLREGGQNVDIEVVGRKGAGFFKFAGTEVAAHHTKFGEKPEFADIEALAQSYMDRFTRRQIASVKVVYMRFISVGRQRPDVLQLLPLKPPTGAAGGAGSEGAASAVQYEFSPEPVELLNDLLPVSVKATLYQCFNDAIVSEHVARMIAMKAATDAAGKMGKSLQRRYNRVRQAQITTELTEIISGAAALE